MHGYESLKFELIGRDDEELLVDQATEAIHRVCGLVDDTGYGDKGSVTIKVDVRIDEESGDIVLTGLVSSVKEPTRNATPMKVRVDDNGDVLTPAQGDLFAVTGSRSVR